MSPNRSTHLTSLELAWADAPAGHRVTPCRQDQYDQETGLYFAPTVHVTEEVPNQVNELSADGLVNRLSSLVHPGLTRADMPSRPPSGAFRDRRDTMPEEVFRQMLRNYEERLVFGGTLDEILSNFSGDRAAQIYEVFSHSLLGNRRNREGLDIEHLRSIVGTCLDRRLPLTMVVPAFPFKDQNPFRTNCSPSHYDLGEAALLIRLHCIALGLNQLHPYDGQCLIVCDGRAYASIFGIWEAGATEYLKGLREVRNSLNLQRTVHFVDQRSVMEKLDRCFSLRSDERVVTGLSSIVEDTEQRLEQLARSREEVSSKLSALSHSMVWNIETRSYLQRVAERDLWRAMNLDIARLDNDTAALRRELISSGWRAALRYAALNISLGACRFWSVAFPDTIRGTVHAKAGQVAIPQMGRGDPWNAVGVLTDLDLEPESVRTSPLWRLGRRDYRPVFLAGSAEPVAYVPHSVAAALNSSW